MNSHGQPTGNPPALVEGKVAYATCEEVRRAIKTLTDPDYIKLMMIAQSFCKNRGIPTSAMEPKELLSEAVLRTCRMDKKWNKGISIVRHLDRAMENISGHLVRERSKMVSFPDGLNPEPEQGKAHAIQDGPESVMASEEETRALIKGVFGDDHLAAQVFVMRVEGFGVPEILAKVNLTESDYEAITRRIRRRISKYVEQTK